MIKEFSLEVVNEIGFYVYRLIDPRNGSTFYVGKGKGNRVFAHMTGALAFDGEQDEASEKINLIREIQQSGLEVIHVIHRHGLSSETAFEVEAALIDAFPGLSNEVIGHGNRERGAMNALQIQNIYKAETIDKITEKCILIKVNRITVESRVGTLGEAPYNATRKSWRVSKTKTQKAAYVFSVIDGVVKEIYQNLEWSVDEERAPRLMFKGEVALENIRKKYIGKRIPPEYRKRGMASPCLYVNI